MQVVTRFILNHEEVQQLGYRLIVSTMGGTLWSTSRVKRAYEEQFSEQERYDIKYTIYRKAYQWYLKTGVPDEVEMSEYEFTLWHKLRKFCVDYCTAYGGKRNG